MKPVVRRLLEGIAYGLWFAALFVLLTWLTFPWDRVRDHAVVAAADAGIGLQLESLKASTSTIKAKGLVLSASTSDSTPLIQIDKLRIGSSTSGVVSAALTLRSLASGEPSGSSTSATQQVLEALGKLAVDAKLYGGELSLSAESDSEVSRISSSLDKLNLDSYLVATRTFSANPKGRLKGGSDLTWHWEDAKKSSGNIDLVANGLVLEGLTIAGFGLPETAFDRSEAHIKISRGRAEIRDTAFDSDVVQVVVEGYINLNTELPRSRLALRMRFKVRDDLDGLLKVQFGSNPRHKDGKGWYHYQVNGTLKRPRLRESPAAARRGRKKEATTPPTPAIPKAASPSAGDDSGPNGSDSEGQDSLNDIRRRELDEERDRLRGERTRRREDRKNKREELIKKRNERQADIDSQEGRPGGGEDLVVDDEDIRRSNLKEGDSEPEGDNEEEPEGEAGGDPEEE